MRHSVFIAVGLIVSAVPAWSQQKIAVKGGQPVDLGPVYWVDDFCQSRLSAVVGAATLSGPLGATLSLRKEEVKTVRQKCPKGHGDAPETPSPGFESAPLEGRLI